MKALLFIIVFIPCLSIAQNKPYYSKWIEVGTISKDELLSKAEKWFVNNKSISHKSITSINKQKGEIEGQALFDCTTDHLDSWAYLKKWGIKVFVKKGKYKHVLVFEGEDIYDFARASKDSLAQLPIYTYWDTSKSNFTQSIYSIPIVKNTNNNSIKRKNYTYKEMVNELVNTLTNAMHSSPT